MAPPLDGLRFQPYSGEADIAHMVDLQNAANAANGNTEVRSFDDYRNALRNVANVDPGLDHINAWVGDRLVATSEINWADTTVGVRHYRSLGAVHPAWRRRGIGTAMLRRNERRLRELAAGHVHEQPPRLITWLDDGDLGGHALMAAADYRQVRVYHHMTRPDLDAIELPPLPSGIHVRPVEATDLPRLWDAIVEAFRDHFGGHDDGPEARRAWLEDPMMDPNLFAVAFERDEIVAGVLGYVNREENRIHGYQRGWTDPVFTRRPWRRRGLARALLGRCLVLLRDAGMTSAQLDVDSQNANDALALYRSHRFERDRGSTEWHKPMSV